VSGKLRQISTCFSGVDLGHENRESGASTVDAKEAKNKAQNPKHLVYEKGKATVAEGSCRK